MFVMEALREVEKIVESSVEEPMERAVAWSTEGWVVRHKVRMNARLRPTPAWWPLSHLWTLYSHGYDYYLQPSAWQKVVVVMREWQLKEHWSRKALAHPLLPLEYMLVEVVRRLWYL